MIINNYKTIFRGVAQPGSASGLGPEGRRFESSLPDHLIVEIHIFFQFKINTEYK